MQARRGRKHRQIGTKRTARPGAAGHKDKRLAAFVCGLLLCAGVGLALRACAGPAAPEGCSLDPLVPQAAFVFPLGTSGWSLSSGYGWREDPLAENGPEAEETDFHRGVDLACAEGTPVLAAMDGVVSMADRSTSYGNYVRLLHEDGTETLYAHLQYLYVRPGEVVKAGQPLGCAGQTGRATGPHLHFELFQNGKQQDPTRALGLPEAKP